MTARDGSKRRYDMQFECAESNRSIRSIIYMPSGETLTHGEIVDALNEKLIQRSPPRDDNDELPDRRGPAIIIEGSVLGGFKFIGPFMTIDVAFDWHKTRSLPGILGLACTIALLVDPLREQVKDDDNHERF